MSKDWTGDRGYIDQHVPFRNMDFVVPMFRASCITFIALNSLLQMAPVRQLYMITQKESCSVIISLLHDPRLRCIDENLMRSFLKLEDTYTMYPKKLVFRKNWYDQQMMKLGAGLYIPELSEMFVVWDSDMVLLGRTSFQNSTKNCTMVHIGGNLVKGYEQAFHSLFPNLKLQRKDLVAHHVVFTKTYVLKFLEDIGGESPKTKAWVKKIVGIALSGTDPIHGFSEYLSYLNWVRNKHPASQCIHAKKLWVRFTLRRQRHATQLLDYHCCPKYGALVDRGMSRNEYVGFEAFKSKVPGGMGVMNACNNASAVGGAHIENVIKEWMKGEGGARADLPKASEERKHWPIESFSGMSSTSGVGRGLLGHEWSFLSGDL